MVSSSRKASIFWLALISLPLFNIPLFHIQFALSFVSLYKLEKSSDAAAAAHEAGDVHSSSRSDPRIAQVVSQLPADDQHQEPVLDDSASLALCGAEQHFRSFIKKHGKVYKSHHEYLHRFQIFKRNLIKAFHHQAMDPTAVHGITPFSDLSEEEFEKQFLGVHPLQLATPSVNESTRVAPILPVDGLPPSFDWRERGAVTEVKNQGLCGACWAFTTVGAIEGANYLATGKLLKLSEQQLVDCDRKCNPADQRSCDSGCRGGLMTNAYEYLMEAGGLMTAEDYPYKAAVGQCQFKKERVAVKLGSFSVISLDEDQIAANLVKHGPLAVALNAAFMQTYIGGVSCPLLCSKNFVNHGVLLVGYQERGYSTLRFSYKPYWILKNSWGAHWGEQGYYKLCRGLGECGINTMVSSVAAISVVTAAQS